MAGLLNALQAASNVTAENVSFPVDALAWVLRKAGLPIPANPIMGSDWMREKGLTAPVEPGWSRVAGETAGLVGPAVVSQFAPQIARGLLKGGENLAAPANVNRGYSAGQRGIFMGDQSKTWNKEAASKARQMDKAGVDPKKIWEETGTFKGPDGKWRQEIDDSGALFNAMLENGGATEKSIARGTGSGLNYGPLVGPKYSLLKHDKLYDAYGDALPKNTFIGNRNTLLNDGPQGSFDENWSAVNLYAPMTGKEGRSISLHELQHAVQQREGFAAGGSPDMFATQTFWSEPTLYNAKWATNEAKKTGLPIEDIVKQKNLSSAVLEAAKRPDLERLYEDAVLAKAPYDSYRRLAGEAEARAVQTRMGMDAATRRQTFPLDSYDVPVDQLIVRGGSGPQMSMTPTKYDASAPKVADGFVRLFRAESPTTKFDDVFDKGGLSQFASAKDGTRFTDDMKYAEYFRSSYGKDAQLKYLDVPKEMAEAGRINGYEFKIPLGEESALKILERNGQGLLDEPVKPALLGLGAGGAAWYGQD